MPISSTKNSRMTITRQGGLKICAEFIITKLGSPWVALGRGPDGFDCWGFVVSTWKHIGWDSAPDFPYGPAYAERREALVSIVLRKKAYDPDWVHVEQPQDLCLCVMFKHGHAHHVGIYADGSVFHCVEGRGVLGTTLGRTLTLGYDKIEFYNHKEMPWL